MIRATSLVSVLAFTTACASVPPQPMIEEAAFVEAAFVEETPERAVEIVEIGFDSGDGTRLASEIE